MWGMAFDNPIEESATNSGGLLFLISSPARKPFSRIALSSFCLKTRWPVGEDYRFLLAKRQPIIPGEQADG